MDQGLVGWALRQTPANLEAEQALLGAILANNKALDAVQEFLRPEHFYDPVHQDIFAAVCEITSQGRVADAVSLRPRFQHDPRLADVGGAGYLAQLLTALVGIVNAREYGRAVRDAWMRREIIGAATDAVNESYGPSDMDGYGVLEALDAALLRVHAGAGDSAATASLGECVAEAVQMTRDASKRKDGLAGITTGFAALNRMTNGLLPEAMLVLAARPSMGKTGLGMAIACRVAAAGKRVLFWSGEMSGKQLGARVAAAHAGLSTTSVFTARALMTPEDAEHSETRPLTDAEWDKLGLAGLEAGRLKLEVDERPGITVAALRARARRMKRQGGLDLLVVDYLGLMMGSEVARRNGRYAEVTEISAGLKALAKELKIPVLVLSQLNRASEAREDKRPTLADLRDSGAVEQDADTVMFLHRPHYYLSRQAPPEKKPKEGEEEYATRLSDFLSKREAAIGVAEILVAKNRHGPPGRTRLRFCDRTTWFHDETEPENGPAWGDMLEPPA